MIKEYKKPYKMNDCKFVAEQMQDFVSDDREFFVVFYMDSQVRTFKREIIHIGGLNSSIVDPRSLFKRALLNSASSIIISHTHPSGHLEPSEEDRYVTKKIQEAGEILQIKLLDHVIVSKGGEYSFNQHNWID